VTSLAPPSAGPTNATVTSNGAGTPIQLNLSGGAPTSVAVATPPAHGTATVSGTTIDYTPAPGFTGTDTFTYTVTNPAGTSTPATVTIVVTAAAPVATAKTATTSANQPVTIAVTGGDTGPVASVALVAQPTHGTASVSGLNVIYTPAANYFGPDSFTYTDTGAGGVSPAATVSITVTPLAAPTAAALSASAASGQSVNIDATAGATGAPFTVAAIATQPQNGTASVNGQVLTYTAPANFSGIATFTYTLANAFGVSTPATATVTVNPAPIALGVINVTVKAGGETSVDLTQGASGGPFTAATVLSLSPADAGTTSVSIQLGAAPAAAAKGAAGSGSGSAAAAAPGPHYILTFKPSLSFSGPATVTFTISNAFATSAPGKVVFAVQPRPDPTLDPNVGALIAAQTEAARRFGEAQIENFDRRLESLHRSGRSASVNGLSFGLDSDVEDPWEAARRRQTGGLWPVGPDRPGFANANANAADSGKPAVATEGGPGKPSDLAFWSGGAIDLGLHRGSAALAKFRFTTNGVSFGADYRLSDRLTLGAGAGYGHDQSRIDNDGSRVTANNYVGAIYGDYRAGRNTFIDAVIGHGSLSFDSHRAIAADTTFADGRRHGEETFASVTAGYDFQHGPLLVSTYGRLDTIRGALDAFTETEIGGGANALSFNRQSLSVLTSTLGLRGGYSFQARSGLWSPHLRIEYKYDFETAGLATLQYADALAGPTYSRPADPLNQSRFLLGVGTDLHFRDVSLSLDYQASVEGREEFVHQIIGKFALKF